MSPEPTQPHTPRIQAAQITDQPIDEEHIRALVADDQAGAVVVFVGAVRNHDADQDVLSLDYEAHPRAQKHLRDVIEQVAAEHDLLRVAAVHRVGELQIGDTAVIVAGSSAHRPAAFTAVAELIHEIKREVPIWKRQHYVSGVSEWVGINCEDNQDSAAANTVTLTAGD